MAVVAMIIGALIELSKTGLISIVRIKVHLTRAQLP